MKGSTNMGDIYTKTTNCINEQIMKSFLKVEKSHLLNIVRRGLTMLVPIIMVGAVAHAILYFPNDSFSHLITERYAWISTLLEMVYKGTFGMFSMILVVALAVSYAMEKNEAIDKMFFYAITAIASFGTQLVMSSEEKVWEILGNQGCFVAMMVGLLASVLFSKLQNIEFISFSFLKNGSGNFRFFQHIKCIVF